MEERLAGWLACWLSGQQLDPPLHTFIRPPLHSLSLNKKEEPPVPSRARASVQKNISLRRRLSALSSRRRRDPSCEHDVYTGIEGTITRFLSLAARDRSRGERREARGEGSWFYWTHNMCFQRGPFYGNLSPFKVVAPPFFLPLL